MWLARGAQNLSSVTVRAPETCEPIDHCLLCDWRRNYVNITRNPMSKSKPDTDTSAADRDLYSGLIRLHVLHHAVEGPVFGLGMIEELARHGYRISAGSLYPLLQGLEKKGYLRSTEQRNGKSLRRVYRATPLGRKALTASKSKVRELFHELIEGD
jgi:PadR family transcriptional regulator, regulatory protein PadR